MRTRSDQEAATDAAMLAAMDATEKARLREYDAAMVARDRITDTASIAYKEAHAVVCVAYDRWDTAYGKCYLARQIASQRARDRAAINRPLRP